MNKTEAKRLVFQEEHLVKMGFTPEEANKLRLISLTLHRWYERECNGEIEVDEQGIARHFYERHDGIRKGFKIPNRESGALKRLETILKDKPYTYYCQTDPRGAALYLIPNSYTDQYYIYCNYSSIGFCVY